MARKTIVVLATLDTKGREAEFLAQQIEKLGYSTRLVDSGVVGAPAVNPGIAREQVALAGGVALAELLKNPDRAVAAPVMAAGATKLISGLVANGQAHGIVSLGGTQGTTLSTYVMRALPYGFPKVMVSTMASGNVAPWVDIKDITMMFSVTDILGLNPVMRKILANAAGAVRSPVLLGFSGVYLHHPERLTREHLSDYAALGNEVCRRISVPTGEGYNPYEVVGSGLKADVLIQARLALQKAVEDFMLLLGSAGKA